MNVYSEYTTLSKKALMFPILLAITLLQHLCETGFSTLMTNAVKPHVCLKLMSIQPDIHKLTAAMQQHQPSH